MISQNEFRPAVVVIGGSGGIGRAIAKVAAQDHGIIVLTARSTAGLIAAAAEVREAGAEVLTFELDLLAKNAPKLLEDFLTANGVICDVLVNSAGYGLRGAATAIPIEEQLGIIDLNIRALTELTLHFLPKMIARKRGGIINLSSVAGFVPGGPYMALYYASKGFVRSFSLAIHEEVRRTGVTVTCLAPGPVSTEFYARAGARQASIFSLLPKLEPQHVAESAWRGFKSRRRLVVPGVSARLAILVTSLLPATLLLPLIARLQRSGNDPCPCGSGKKFKKCHGTRRT